MPGGQESAQNILERFAAARWAVICRDRDDSAAARAAGQTQHFAYIERILSEIELAGPLFDAAGRRAVGSFIVFRTQDEQRARALLEGDPYFRAGIWQTIEYFPFLPAAGHYVGGKIW